MRGEGVDGLVLLTANGQQMESSKVIGAYPIGTVIGYIEISSPCSFMQCG